VLLFLGVGVLIGMRHALEADHLAAVVALSTRARGRLATMLRGAAWGLGHTTALLVVGGACLAFGTSVSEASEQWLERGVGVMLIVLGVQVIARLRQTHVHIDVHAHPGGIMHAHAHRHDTDEVEGDPHRHPHADRSHLRAALVGTVHGMAGSAALVVLTSATSASFWSGVAYIACFGVGSIIGMAALSLAISLPLEFSARRLAHAYGVIELPVAVITIALGLWMVR
jgi:cytochrome c biogenesis protein CcdA